MDTKYVVFSGPDYPSAVKVEATAHSCLVAQAGCTMQVLLAFTVPTRPNLYSETVLQRKKKAGKAVLEGYAKTLNNDRVSAAAKEVLLVELNRQREIQINVIKDIKRARRLAERPTNFRADFCNLCAGEREGSFSPPGRLDGYW